MDNDGYQPEQDVEDKSQDNQKKAVQLNGTHEDSKITSDQDTLPRVEVHGCGTGHNEPEQSSIEVKIITDHSSPQKDESKYKQMCMCVEDGKLCECKKTAISQLRQPMNQMMNKESWNKCKSIMLIGCVVGLIIWVICYVTLSSVL